MRLVFGAALMVAAVLVQVTWAPRLEVGGSYPNLALMAVIAITWTMGVRAGLVWACLAGVLLDLTSSGPLGPHALALLAGAYITGFWTRNVARDSPVHPALAAAVSTALYSVILVGADDTLGLPVPPLGVAVQLVFAASVYNAVLMPIALFVMRKLQGPPPGRTEVA